MRQKDKTGWRHHLVLLWLAFFLVTPVLADQADRKAGDDSWRIIDSEEMVDPVVMFPQTISLALGFHIFPEITLSRGTRPKPGSKIGEDEFEYALFHEFISGFLNSASIELGYGYRLHRHFNLQTLVGFIAQKYEKWVQVTEFAALVKYRYMGGHLLVVPQARFPVSNVDFGIGLGLQTNLARISFQARSETRYRQDEQSPVDRDGYRLSFEELDFAVGGVAQVLFEYRPHDNWGIEAEYRYAWVPGYFKGDAFDHGGHYGLLINHFHF